MRHDDRLATVLRLSATGQAMARIQWRQIVDLLGTAPVETRNDLIDKAYVRLNELSAGIAPAERAAILAEPGMRLRSARLVAGLAAAEPQAARAALNAADLDEAQWLDLVPALPPYARVLLTGRRALPSSVGALLTRLGANAPGLPAGEAALAAAAQSGAGAAPVATSPASLSHAVAPDAALPEAAIAAIEDIGTIVRRIEAFRRAREANRDIHALTPSAEAAAPGDSPRLPLGEEPSVCSSVPVAAFDFASDTEGRIVWSEPSIAPMVVGLGLGNFDLGDGAPFSELLRRHQPIRAGRLKLAGAPAVAGEWQVDAAARFDSPSGRFAGHIGRFRRAIPTSVAPDKATSESGRLREMLHELRTPVNAVQGFAEIIQQQLFGPTPHEYRALASTIIAEAARLLGGFEELERFARLDTGAMELAPGTSDLAASFAATAQRLTPHDGEGFALEEMDEPLPVALEPIETERLSWRLLANLASACAPGETLTLRRESGRQSSQQGVRIRLPAALAACDDEALYHATIAPSGTGAAPSVGMFGIGFALRLSETEARTAGGALRRDGDWLVLTLPGVLPSSNDSPTLTEQGAERRAVVQRV